LGSGDIADKTSFCSLTDCGGKRADNPEVELIWPSRNFATERAREIAKGHAFMPLLEDSFNFVVVKSRPALRETPAAGTAFGCFLAAGDFFRQQL